MVKRVNAADVPKDNLITPGGFKKLNDEVEFLWRKERPRIVEEVRQAAAQGDRSENAEYIYGKKKLREIDRRLEFLQRRIERAKVIDPARQTATVIEFGATVTMVDEEDKTKTYTIVGEDEAAPEKGFISWKSPIGLALLGKKGGDYVEVETPKGTLGVEITAFLYKPC